MHKAFTLMVMGATALSSLASSAAFAVVTLIDPVPPAHDPSPGTLSAMQYQCTALAAAHGPKWEGTLDESSIVPSGPVSGPTETGTRMNKTNIVGTGNFTPGTTYIDGEPFRIGGSVNMFGDQYATSGSWSDSEYDFEADFETTYSFAFNCNMTEEVTTPATGHHVWTHDPSDPNAAACLAYDRNGLFQGQDQGQCVWVVDSPGGTADEPRPDEAGTPINQAQIDTLAAHEDHGGPVQANGGPFHVGQTVICISPSTSAKKGVPGEWVKKNGYTGTHCTTDWFKNFAVWGSGTESSNGTYISVPDYQLY